MLVAEHVSSLVGCMEYFRARFGGGLDANWEGPPCFSDVMVKLKEGKQAPLRVSCRYGQLPCGAASAGGVGALPATKEDLSPSGSPQSPRRRGSPCHETSVELSRDRHLVGTKWKRKPTDADERTGTKTKAHTADWPLAACGLTGRSKGRLRLPCPAFPPAGSSHGQVRPAPRTGAPPSSPVTTQRCIGIPTDAVIQYRLRTPRGLSIFTYPRGWLTLSGSRDVKHILPYQSEGAGRY